VFLQLGPTTAAHLTADVCIIGAGIAGLTIARELASSGQDILLIESGGERFEAGSQELNSAEIAGHPYRGHEEGRNRVLGGNSIAWGAQLITIGKEEWDRRDDVGMTGWPIPQSEIARYDDRVYSQFGIVLRRPPRRVSKRFWRGGDDLQFIYSHWAPFKKRNLANAIGQGLRSQKNVRVLLHATAIELNLDESRQLVTGVVCANLTSRCSIQAKVFIVAAGALEATRLLMLSDKQFPNGIGNQSGLVGKYFQDHLSVTVADLDSDLSPLTKSRFSPFFLGSVFCYPRVVPTPSAAKLLHLPGIFAHIQTQVEGENAFDVLKKIFQRLQMEGKLRVKRRELGVLVQELPYLSKMGVARLLSWPLPTHRLARSFLQVDVEHLPSLASRISLSDKMDILGMRKLKIEWRVGEFEINSIAKFAHVLKSNLFNDSSVIWRDLSPQHLLNHGWDTYHPSGTTVMSREASSGVVDTDLKVHGIKNLYIASTSVFPSAGIANPTFTLLGLCYRLVDHLKATQFNSRTVGEN